MSVFPNDYTKEEFKHFLKEKEADETIIQKFETLPETVTYNGKDYTISIRATLFKIGEGFYNYWTNYKSDDDELLFQKKAFTDIVDAIDYLITGVGNLN